MQVKDIRGKQILKGFQVRYAGTGSAGEVVDFKLDNDRTWVLVDTTDLWYDSKSLEVISVSSHKKLDKKSKIEEDHNVGEDIKGKIKRSKSKFEDVDMSNELCDGGG